MKLLVGLAIVVSLVFAAGGAVSAEDPPDREDAYAALHDYFDGESTLSETETVLRQYLEATTGRVSTASYHNVLILLLRRGSPGTETNCRNSGGHRVCSIVGSSGAFYANGRLRADAPPLVRAGSPGLDRFYQLGQSATCGGKRRPSLRLDDQFNRVWLLCSGHPANADSQWVPVQFQRVPGV